MCFKRKRSLLTIAAVVLLLGMTACSMSGRPQSLSDLFVRPGASQGGGESDGAESPLASDDDASAAPDALDDASGQESAQGDGASAEPAQNDAPALVFPESPEFHPAPSVSLHAGVTSIKLDVVEVSLERDDSMTLVPSVFPSDAEDVEINYSTSDSSVATVDDDGTIHAVGEGTAIIEVTVGDVFADVTVTVTVPVTSVTVSVNKTRFRAGEFCVFTVEVLPKDASDKTYTVTAAGAGALSDESTASCDSHGDLTITATASNGVTGSRTVSVIDLVYYADEVFRLTNIERANAGLSAFSHDGALTRTAVVRANELPSYFSHTRPDGSSCFTAYDENGVSYRAAGENIAEGHTSPREVVDGWMNSPGHRANILNSDFSYLGVGVAMSDSGRLSWSQNFTG